MEKKKSIIKTIAKNKKAYYDYEIDDKYVAGLRLSGTEIKSVRLGNVSIKEAFCYIRDSEIYIKGMYIKKYEYGSDNNHEEVHDRKLLLTKQQIKKIDRKVSEKGFSLVPLSMLVIDGWAKIEVGVGKGKKTYDKKDKIKERDITRDLDKSLRNA